jgi:hypothetical protein
MKHQTFFKRMSWLLAICFAAALALSACNSTSEHPNKAGQTQKEHPEHPQPANTQK